MIRLNRDIVTAVLLLVLTTAFYVASYSIKKTSYGTVGSEVWPRAVLVVLGIFCLVYLVSALRAPASEARSAGGGIIAWLASYRNAFACFIMYGLFLITLDYLGMLIASVLFVFLLLNILGGWSLRNLAVHGTIAIVSMGAMWTIFTFGLRVILPEGEILRIW
jgi:hypothetical protein